MLKMHQTMSYMKSKSSYFGGNSPRLISLLMHVRNLSNIQSPSSNLMPEGCFFSGAQQTPKRSESVSDLVRRSEGRDDDGRGQRISAARTSKLANKLKKRVKCVHEGSLVVDTARTLTF